VVNETLRWQPIGPLGLPRKAEEEGEYRGYRIPKGAIFLPSIEWFTHDPAAYHEPESFKPERFLAPYNEPDPHSYVFGFGRRVCPGKLLADSMLWLTVARSLAVYDIRKGVDENGKEIEPVVRGTPGIVSHPIPYGYRMVPRSEKHAELIRSVEVDHPWEEGDAKFIDDLNHKAGISL
jgi:cytochrome P450